MHQQEINFKINDFMKTRALILKLFLATLVLAVSNDVFAGRTTVRLIDRVTGQDLPRTRAEPAISCTADKEAGYVELLFRVDFGEVDITLTDSSGNVVDGVYIDTIADNVVILNIPDAQDTYTLHIEGEKYSGEGKIN